jgi:hypothetical protein
LVADLGVVVGHVVPDRGDSWCPVVEDGGDLLAEAGQFVALDFLLDAGDRLTEVVDNRLADGCPSHFGGVEHGCERIDLPHSGPAVSAARARVDGASLRGIEAGPEVVAISGVLSFGGVVPTAPPGEQVPEVVVEVAEAPVSGEAALLWCGHRVEGCWRGGVGDPALGLIVRPVDAEVVAGLIEVVGDGVEGGAGTGSAEGDVGQFPAAASGEDVGAVVGGALGAVDGEGVAVVQVIGVDPLTV